MENAFQELSRRNLTFQTVRGTAVVNELWTIPLRDSTFSLNEMYKELYHNVNNEEISFFEQEDVSNSDDNVRLNVVIAIMTYRVEQQNAEKRKAKNKVKRERILELLNEKQNEKDKTLSVAKLNKMLEELSD